MLFHPATMHIEDARLRKHRVVQKSQARREQPWYLRSRLANALPSRGGRIRTSCRPFRVSSTATSVARWLRLSRELRPREIGPGIVLATFGKLVQEPAQGIPELAHFFMLLERNVNAAGVMDFHRPQFGGWNVERHFSIRIPKAPFPMRSDDSASFMNPSSAFSKIEPGLSVRESSRV